MKRSIAVLALVAVAAPWAALAAAPKALTVVETVEVKAPVAKVWATIKDFDSLDKWHPGFSKDEIVKGSNSKAGAVRSLTVKGGPTFTEELISFNGRSHSYKYKITDESSLPIHNYSSTIAVKAGKDGMTVVTWSGWFKRKNTADNPPDAESDAGVKKFISGVYRGGLDNLKKMLEG